jgi:hypothetical protein
VPLSPIRRELPSIREIRLDKSSVCRGEENFVNVRAAGPTGDDAHLRISLSSTDGVGPRIPFRLYGALASNDIPRVVVQGRGGAEVSAPLPPVEVKDCDADVVAKVDMQTIGIATDEWRFTAQVVSGRFTPESYDWEFGDGTQLTTRRAQVPHSYRLRQQTKRYSSFLISVTMRDASGAVVQASRALGMSNPAFGMLERHGEVALFSHRLEEGGNEQVQLYHAYQEAVELERVQVRVRDEDSRSERPAGTFAAGNILGVERLIPGELSDVHLALAELKLPDARPLTLVFQVEGTSARGVPASGVFSTRLQ